MIVVDRKEMASTEASRGEHFPFSSNSHMIDVQRCSTGKQNKSNVGISEGLGREGMPGGGSSILISGES